MVCWNRQVMAGLNFPFGFLVPGEPNSQYIHLGSHAVGGMDNEAANEITVESEVQGNKVLLDITLLHGSRLHVKWNVSIISRLVSPRAKPIVLGFVAHRWYSEIPTVTSPSSC